MSSNNDETQKYKFSLALGGEDTVSLKLLANQASSLSNLLDIAAGEEINYKVCVSGVKKGSFVIEFVSEALPVLGLYFTENANLIGNMLVTIKEWLLLKKHLKEREPKNIKKLTDGYSIENVQGDAMVVSNNGAKILSNSSIDAGIINFINGPYNDHRTFVKIYSDGNKTEVNIPEEDYMSYITPIPKTERLEKYINRVEAKLLVKKPDLIGDSKWEFHFGKTIRAKIEDENWKKSFKEHKFSIMSGTRLVVTLRIENDLDDKNNPIEDDVAYFVEKVHRLDNPFDEDESQIKL